MKIENLKVTEITPYENNPRKNDKSVSYVAESIRQFGFKVPIIIDANGVIVCGHTRFKAAKQLGMNEVPCIRADDLTDEQIRAFRLADNKVSEYSSWDLDALADELQGISDIDMEKLGFDIPEDEEIVEDDYEEKVPEVPKSQLGDIYKLGDHLLMCGDATKIEDVQRLCGNIGIDLLLTDPPYNIDYTGKTKKSLKIINDAMDNSDFRCFLKNVFSNAKQVMKPGAAFYVWHADSEGYNFRGVDRRWLRAQADSHLEKASHNARTTGLSMDSRALFVRMERWCRTRLVFGQKAKHGAVL